VVTTVIKRALPVSEEVNSKHEQEMQGRRYKLEVHQISTIPL